MNKKNIIIVLITIVITVVIVSVVAYLWHNSILEKEIDTVQNQLDQIILKKDQLEDEIYELTREPDRYIEILTPNGEESLCLGEDFLITWKSKGLRMVKVEIHTPNAAYYPIGASPADFNETGKPGTGTFLWKVGTTQGGIDLQAGNFWEIIVSSSDDNSITDKTDGVFYIERCEG